MSPTFSIIIPVYNVAPYLRECLDSVLAQTYTDWEAICVDDGSTDGSGAILDEYAAKDKRFRVMHQANEGTHLARIKGIDLSTGEWIGFQDADDVIDAKRFELFAKRIKETSADIVLGDVVERHEDGRFFYHPFSRALSRHRALCDSEILQAMLNSNGAEYEWHVLCGRVFRRGVVNRAMEFLRREQGHFVMCEDVGWSIALSLCGRRLEFAHGAPYVYFRNAESSTCAIQDIKGLEKVADHFKQSIRLAHAALDWGGCAICDHALLNAWFHRYLEGWECRRRKSFPQGDDIFLPLITGKIGKATDPVFGCSMPIDEKDIVRAHLLAKNAKIYLFRRMLRAWLRIVLFPLVVATRPIRHRKVER